MTEADRWTMPVIKRYVRRLLSGNEQQYRSWLKANEPRDMTPDERAEMERITLQIHSEARTTLSQPNDEGERK